MYYSRQYKAMTLLRRVTVSSMHVLMIVLNVTLRPVNIAADEAFEAVDKALEAVDKALEAVDKAREAVEEALVAVDVASHSPSASSLHSVGSARTTQSDLTTLMVSTCDSRTTLQLTGLRSPKTGAKETFFKFRTSMVGRTWSLEGKVHSTTTFERNIKELIRSKNRP